MPEPPAAVIVAMDHEARPLVRRFGLTPMTEHEHAGVLYEARGGRAHHRAELVVLVTGVGPDRAGDAAGRLLDRRPVRQVVIAGLCGALHPLLRVGELVWPDVLVDGATHQLYHRPLAHPRTGRHISVDRLVATPQDKAAIHHRHQVDSVDMESAAIAAACEERAVSWICARAVGDTAEQTLPASVDELVDDRGYARPWRAARRLAASPARLYSLAQLARRSTRAADALAAGLGSWFEGTAPAQAPDR